MTCSPGPRGLAIPSPGTQTYLLWRQALVSSHSGRGLNAAWLAKTDSVDGNFLFLSCSQTSALAKDLRGQIYLPVRCLKSTYKFATRWRQRGAWFGDSVLVPSGPSRNHPSGPSSCVVGARPSLPEPRFPLHKIRDGPLKVATY